MPKGKVKETKLYTKPKEKVEYTSKLSESDDNTAELNKDTVATIKEE